VEIACVLAKKLGDEWLPAACFTAEGCCAVLPSVLLLMGAAFAVGFCSQIVFRKPCWEPGGRQRGASLLGKGFLNLSAAIILHLGTFRNIC